MQSLKGIGAAIKRKIRVVKLAASIREAVHECTAECHEHFATDTRDFAVQSMHSIPIDAGNNAINPEFLINIDSEESAFRTMKDRMGIIESYVLSTEEQRENFVLPPLAPITVGIQGAPLEIEPVTRDDALTTQDEALQCDLLQAPPLQRWEPRVAEMEIEEPELPVTESIDEFVLNSLSNLNSSNFELVDLHFNISSPILSTGLQTPEFLTTPEISSILEQVTSGDDSISGDE